MKKALKQNKINAINFMKNYRDFCNKQKACYSCCIFDDCKSSKGCLTDSEIERLVEMFKTDIAAVGGNQMKIGDKVYIKGVVDEIRKDTIIIKNKGGYFGTVEEEIVKRTESVKPIGEWFKGYNYPDGEYWKCKKCGELIKVNYPMKYCSNCGDRKR